jgi:kinesin family protein 5
MWFCRFRPPNALELRENGAIVVDIDEETSTNVKLKGVSDPAGGFNFDRAFGMQSTQEEIFEYGVRGIVDEVVAGYNGTVFAYGQTGSGKSFTMMVCNAVLSVVLLWRPLMHVCLCFLSREQVSTIQSFAV